MLFNCPECELKVSDKAISCPHCGYPLKKKNTNEQWRNKNERSRRKHKRLPNGFGQITELKNSNLRNPYRVMITVGKDSTGKPICKLLKPQSYFHTYNEAYEALVEYNKNPYDLDNDITVEMLYERWSEAYFKSLKSDTSKRTVASAWAYCSSVYKMRVKDLRARHIKGCMDDGCITFKGELRKTTPNIKSRIKSLFNLMLDYAVEYEMVDRNVSRTFNISDDILTDKEASKRSHISFSDDEMKLLWKHSYVKYVDVILIQCYSGWRPLELCNLKLEDVDLDNWIFKGGMKTEAGKNRIVPIHPKIRGFVKSLYEESKSLGNEYFISCIDAQQEHSIHMTYDKYTYRFEKIRDRIGLRKIHRPHDCRKHFITMAKKYNVDEYAIKRIVGHAIVDITEKVYTDRDIEWLVNEVSKIEKESPNNELSNV